MDRTPITPAQRRLASKRPNPVPRVLLILLLFALPLVLIPSVLDRLNPPAPPSPRPDAREELNHALAQEGVVLSEPSRTGSEEAPVEVAGQLVAAADDEAPALDAEDGSSLLVDDEADVLDMDDSESDEDVDEADAAMEDDAW